MRKEFLLFFILFYSFFSTLMARINPDSLHQDTNLDQNFPNPFNASTTIKFNIVSPCRVSIEIFNVIGQKITTLIDEDLPAGSYTKEWNPGNISSGVYFYKLKAGLILETKRLVYVK